MAATINYEVSFKGRVVIPTEDVKKGAEAFDKMIANREAGEDGEPMDGFAKYLSHSEDLETFIQRCVIRAVQDTIKGEFVDGNFRNVGDIQVKING